MLKKILNETQKCHLLEALGKDQTVQQEVIEDDKELIKTIFYGGKRNETYFQQECVFTEI